MSSSFKTNLTVGGSPFDKLQMRRPTPDSDVLASSDDDHEVVAPPPTRPPGLPFPTARRPSWMAQDLPNRKPSLPSASLGPATSQPPTLWNTNSFTATASSSRMKDVLPSPTSAHGPGEKTFGGVPSSETDDAVGFLLGQHTVRKAVRSQSYSVGQGDVGNPASHLRSALRHRPSKPSLLAGTETAAALGQLREDDHDENHSSNGSQHGVPLPSEYWQNERQQSKPAASKQVTIIAPPTRRLSHGMRSMTQNDADDVAEPGNNGRTMPLMRRFSEHVGARPDDASQDDDTRGWGGSVPRFNTEALIRRHSIAHYGTNVGTNLIQPTLGVSQEEEEEEEASPRETALPMLPPAQQDPKWNTSDYFSGFGPAARTINSSAISAAHPAPAITHPPPPPNAYANPTGYGRLGRRIYVVQFKCSRSDIYYLYENTGLEVRVGDLVIVEGDRGHDLGQVQYADLSMEEAKRLKNETNDDHFRWLVLFSSYSAAGAAKNPMLGALSRAHEVPKPGSRPQITGMGVQQDPENKPRMIRRLAQSHEILQLRDKEGEEARAKRMATDKALDHGLQMEILDAEFQWDHHKISFFYYAESYVDFKVLVTDLFKHYKIRIWMSAVNPASVVNPAGMQIKPPSAIGPGAIIPNNAPNASLSVGPLFGNSSYRPNEQYGNRGRAPNPQGVSNPQGSFGYGPFAHQLPTFQNPYQMSQWAQQYLGGEMYNRYDPHAAANRSPMNMGAYYPPTSYPASPAFNHASSNPSFRGGYPATSNANPYAMSNNVPPSAYSTAFNAQTAPFVGFDPDMMAAMTNMNLGGAQNAAGNNNNNGADPGANTGPR